MTCSRSTLSLAHQRDGRLAPLISHALRCRGETDGILTLRRSGLDAVIQNKRFLISARIAEWIFSCTRDDLFVDTRTFEPPHAALGFPVADRCISTCIRPTCRAMPISHWIHFKGYSYSVSFRFIKVFRVEPGRPLQAACGRMRSGISFSEYGHIYDLPTP